MSQEEQEQQQKIFGHKIFSDPNFFRARILFQAQIFLAQNFVGPKNLLTQFFLKPKLCWTQKCEIFF